MSALCVPHAGPFDAEARLAIVGAGAAGLVAALSARAFGIEPLVLERDVLPMGSTALSAGLIPAAGTRWQREAGIVDTPEDFARDILGKAGNQPDPAIVAAVATAIGPVLEWLADRHGFEFSLVENFRYPGHGATRMHGLPSRSGRALIERLRAAAEAEGVLILPNARVETLLTDAAGQPVGLAFRRPDGRVETLGAGALILACNGYGGNPDLVRRHIPALADANYFGHPGNQGEALRWGEALGAATRHLSGHQGHGSVAEPHGILITWATITEGGFQVNRRGERFHNEAAGYSEAAAEVLAQPGGIAFQIFDARIAAIARQFEDFREAEARGAVIGADTPGQLAARVGIEPAALEQTFGTVEAKKRAGARDGFGRDFSQIPPLLPPFCAVRVTGALFHTQGGLVIDPEARVLRADGTPIPALFAAGGAACGVSGPQASGYLSGNGLLTALALGAIAGRSAAEPVLGMARPDGPAFTFW